MLRALLPASGVYENSSHRLGSRGEKVRAILPVWRCVGAKPEPRFVDERRGLKSLAWCFARHLLRGEQPQLAVNKGHQLVGCFCVTLRHSLENVREIADEKTLPDRSSTGKRIYRSAISDWLSAGAHKRT